MLEEPPGQEDVLELPEALKRPRSKESVEEMPSEGGMAHGCAWAAIVVIILGVAGVFMKTVAIGGPRGSKGIIVTGASAVWLGALMIGAGLVVLFAVVRWIRATHSQTTDEKADRP
jgi:protein-S-isoprenylcysteine O-methyltransferase Ste14